MASARYLLLVLIAGVDDPAKPAKPEPLPATRAFQEPGARIAQIGRNLWVDSNPAGRRVLVRGTVCLQEGILEEFMCLARTKEHESIVAADIDPRMFHFALITAGAEPGHPARFVPKFEPPTGDKVEVSVEWKQGEQTKRAKAQDWIREFQTKKAITYGFVFAGSGEIEHPITKQPFYLGNEGDLISVANFASSIVDIAVESSANESEHLFEAFSERIPPLETEVFVILKPAPKPKPQPKDAQKSAPPAKK